MRTIELEIFADHFQFWLTDGDDSFPSADYSEEAVEQKLAVFTGAAMLFTARNLTVPVTIEILDREPTPDFDAWEHAVDGGITVNSGQLNVAGCTDWPEATRIPLEPGIYRLRFSFRGTTGLDPNALEGDDQYRVQLWTAPTLESPVVWKQHQD
jgi:hypothetical protein